MSSWFALYVAISVSAPVVLYALPVEKALHSDATAAGEDQEASAQALKVGVMRREEAMGQPHGAESLAAVHGAAATAWSPREVVSSNVVDLNGYWTSSASGESRHIVDNMATGPSSFKVNLYIKQGGRRVEFEHGGKNYWATLSGRGSLNWNDGNVWTRAVDCKWSDWTDFGACGGPCAPNEQQRERDYEFLQENGGKPCVGPLLRCQESVWCAVSAAEQAPRASSAANASNASGASGASGGSAASHASGHSDDAHGAHASGQEVTPASVATATIAAGEGEAHGSAHGSSHGSSHGSAHGGSHGGSHGSLVVTEEHGSRSEGVEDGRGSPWDRNAAPTRTALLATVCLLAAALRFLAA